MTGRPQATVAGGGIAGLTAALSLAQAGWQVTVLERAPAFGEVGAGLALTSNAMAALKAIGLDELVRQAGHTDYAAGTQDQAGRWLIRLPGDPGDPGNPGHPGLRQIVTLCAIHRQRLHAVLLQAAQSAPDIDLVTGAAVASVRPGVAGGAPAQITWHQSVSDYPPPAEPPTNADHTTDVEHTAEAGLIVAADGLRSTIRAQLFPGTRPHYSGSTSWRAVIDDTTLDDQFIQHWGPGTEFGALRISQGEVYWYGYFRHPEGAAFTDELQAARDHFQTWSPQVQAIIAATTPDRLIRHDVYHLGAGPPRYTWGRVVLIGDAAHAVLPTMGQGAATAIEDGVCVGRLIAALLAAGHGMTAVLNEYDQARRPRCQQIARMSLLTGRFGADLGGGWRQKARNQLLRRAPAATLLKSAAPIVSWTPPQAAPPQAAPQEAAPPQAAPPQAAPVPPGQ